MKSDDLQWGTRLCFLGDKSFGPSVMDRCANKSTSKEDNIGIADHGNASQEGEGGAEIQTPSIEVENTEKGQTSPETKVEDGENSGESDPDLVSTPFPPPPPSLPVACRTPRG